MLTCTCCGAEVTSPSFYANKPYGYSCFAKLFGKSKRVVYVEVELHKVLHCWADFKETLTEEGWQQKKDHYTIKYVYRFKTVKSKPIILTSEFAIKDVNGKFWVPLNHLKKDLIKNLPKLNLNVDIIKDEIK